MSVPLDLHDVHAGIVPGFWPPAPGWWMLAAAVLILAAAFAGWRLRSRRRQAALMRVFDEAVDRADTPSRQVAAMSEVLRRAARLSDPAADRLQGEQWLRFLDDGMPGQPFVNGAGTLLGDGAFRANVAVDDVAALRILARQRYLLWMQQR